MTQVIDLTRFQSPFPAIAQRNQENLLRSFENETARRAREEAFDWSKQLQREQMDENQERYEYGRQLQAQQTARQNAIQDDQIARQKILQGIEAGSSIGMTRDEAEKLQGAFGDPGVLGATLAADSSSRRATANAIATGAPQMSDEQIEKLISSLPEEFQGNAYVAANNSRSLHNTFAGMLNDLITEEQLKLRQLQNNEIDSDQYNQEIARIDKKRSGILSSAIDNGVQLMENLGTGTYRLVPPIRPGSQSNPPQVPQSTQAANPFPGPQNPTVVQPDQPATQPAQSVQPDVFGQQFRSMIPEELPGGMFSGRNRKAVEDLKPQIDSLVFGIQSIDPSQLSLEEQSKLVEEIGFIDQGIKDINKGEFDSPAVQYLLEAARSGF